MKERTMMNKLGWITAAGAALAACGTEPEEAIEPVPGLLAPSCTMTWVPYAVTAIDQPNDARPAYELALDIDERNYDGVDNQIGGALALMAGSYPESWALQAVGDARLAAGQVHWVLEVGTCTDGDEVRVASAWAVDADRDGVLEIVDRSVPSVGERGRRPAVTTRRGVGWVPVGTLFAGSPGAATPAWQLGLSLTTELTIGADAVDGLLGIGLDVQTPATLTPLARFFTERLVAGASPFARQLDDNDDGVIDNDEALDVVDDLVVPDLDLGDDCAEVECYAPLDGDLINDHVSLGIGIHATRVALE
jgi:hypothetical protein